MAARHGRGAEHGMDEHRGEGPHPGDPKGLDEGEVDIPKGMTTMKKEDLLEEMRKRGLSAGQHETRASMMRKIRADAEALHGGTAETLMGFGKHAALRYAEVKEKHPDYVKWATEVVKEEGVGTNVKLRKFVRWLTKTEKKKEDEEARAPTPPPSSAAASAEGKEPTKTTTENTGKGYSRTAKRGAPKEDDKMDAQEPVMPENPTPQSNTEKMILEALEHMSNRMDDMEKKNKDREEAQSDKGRSEASWQMPGSES